MIKNIRHTGIVVHTLPRALSLYRDVLGFKIINEGSFSSEWFDVNFKWIKLQSPCGQLIELYEMHWQDCFHSYNHLAFTVENIEETKKALCNCGIKSCSDIIVNNGHYLLFCRDFDGNMLEFVQELK